MKKSYKDDNFGSRIAKTTKARRAVLERIKAQPGQEILLSKKRKAERQATAETKAARLAKKKAEKEVRLAKRGRKRSSS